MASANRPPKVNVTMVKNRNLPSTSVPWNDNLQPVDILLLTVKDCEFLSCLSFLNPGFYKSHHDNLGYVYFGCFGDSETTKLRIAVVKCHKGSTVPGGSAIVVKIAAKVLRPKAVFNVGFCGCLDERKAKLGDVVVSAKLITYAHVTVTADGIQECGIRVPLERHLGNLMKNCGEGWEPPLEDEEALKVEIHRDGVLLSGPEEVAKKERRDQLNARFPEAIAIEMEGEGLYTAARDLGIEWIVVKGVSDFADGKFSEVDSWRSFASIMAASLTFHILSDPIVFRNLPHYGAEQQRPDFQLPTAWPHAGPSAACPIGRGPDDVYKMTAEPRGLALIINNKTFNPLLGHETREGSEKDVEELDGLFRSLEFEVQIKQDLGKKHLLSTLKEVASADHSEYDCFVLCLMSHGVKGGYILCTGGGSIHIDEALEMFNSVNCKTLEGKPKVVFIQACRGNKEDAVGEKSKRKQCKLSADPSATAICDVQFDERAHRNADFLIANSTVDDYVSYRRSSEGSYFVLTLVKVFREKRQDEHLLELMTSVNKDISQLTMQPRKDIKAKQICEFKSSLTKKLFF